MVSKMHCFSATTIFLTFQHKDNILILSLYHMISLSAELEMKLDTAMSLKRKITNDDHYNDQEWDSNPFKPEWLQQIETWQSNILDVHEVEKHKDWFQYIHDPQFPHKSHYNCFICNHYANTFPTTQWLGQLSTNLGVLKEGPNAIAANNRILREHRKSKSHQIVLYDLKKQKKLKLDAEINGLITDDEYPYTITNRYDTFFLLK